MDSICDSGNLPADAENANLNEATPISASDIVPKETSGADNDDAISSTTPDKFIEELEHDAINLPKPTTSSETVADFFSSELSISDVPTEKITENVEDTVQDLENLLGESNDSYRFSRESFDNSKLPDSFDEVNSSNISDLFGLEQTNLDGPSFDCNILPENINKIECESKELPKLEAPIEQLNTVSDLDAELSAVVSEPLEILKIPEEVSTLVNLDAIVESQGELECPSNAVTSECDVAIQPSDNCVEDVDLIKIETVVKSDLVLEPEIEGAISTSNVCSEDTLTNEVEQIASQNVVQNTTELFEAINSIENVLVSTNNETEEKEKLSKERGLAHIIPESLKRRASTEIERELKHFKSDLPSDLTISLVSNSSTTLNEPDVTITRVESPDIKQEETIAKQKEQISAFFSRKELPDPLADIPIFEITLQTATSMSSAPPRPAPAIPAAVAATPLAPRKRGRPRKVPLEVREEFIDPKEAEVPQPVEVKESTRPKRSCRGANDEAVIVANDEDKIVANEEAIIVINEEAKIVANDEANTATTDEAMIVASDKEPPKEEPQIMESPPAEEIIMPADSIEVDEETPPRPAPAIPAAVESLLAKKARKR